LTITSDFFNRSPNVDCSEMDLDESISHSNGLLALSSANNNNNNSTNVSSSGRDFAQKNSIRAYFNSKTLTSTVSAQRTHSLSNLKSGITTATSNSNESN
jgi:hypothetical protein